MGHDWVLVADLGYEQNRTALVTVRALAAGGNSPALTVSSKWSLAAASKDCRRAVRVPQGGGDAFAEAVHGELARRRYVATLATSDAALLALGAPVGHLLDKRDLARAATACGLSTPPTRCFAGAEELLEASADLEYPIVVKPPLSRFRPVRLAGPEPLLRTIADNLGLKDGPLLVQPYLPDPLRAVCGVVWEGRHAAVVHQLYRRTWPPDCGGACAAVTSLPDVELEECLIVLLSGFEGIYMAQFAGERLLDLNPRPYGSLPLAVAAGANLASIYCDLLTGSPAPSEPIRGRPGVAYRWLEGDVRHLAAAVRAGRMPVRAALRGLLRRPGTATSTESWRDPKPTVVRLAYGLSRRWRDRE